MDAVALAELKDTLDVSVHRIFFVGDSEIVFYDTRGSLGAGAGGGARLENKRVYHPFEGQSGIEDEFWGHLIERACDRRGI